MRTFHKCFAWLVFTLYHWLVFRNYFVCLSCCFFEMGFISPDDAFWFAVFTVNLSWGVVFLLAIRRKKKIEDLGWIANLLKRGISQPALLDCLFSSICFGTLFDLKKVWLQGGSIVRLNQIMLPFFDEFIAKWPWEGFELHFTSKPPKITCFFYDTSGRTYG